MTEERVQIAAVEYLKLKYPKVRYCASLGGIRIMSHKQRVKAKLTGYVKGFPDLFIYHPVIKKEKHFCGCALEIKKAKNSYATPEQKQWIAHLKNVGYYAAIVKGLDNVLKEIDFYLNE